MSALVECYVINIGLLLSEKTLIIFTVGEYCLIIIYLWDFIFRILCELITKNTSYSEYSQQILMAS